MGADRLSRRRIERVPGSDEGEHSARTKFSQSLDKEVVVNRSREKTLTGFEVPTVHDGEVAEGHVGYDDIKGFVAERRVLEAQGVDSSKRIQRLEQARGQRVKLNGSACGSNCTIRGLQTEEATDSG